mgnify:CR=1 FL=1
MMLLSLSWGQTLPGKVKSDEVFTDMPKSNNQLPVVHPKTYSPPEEFDLFVTRIQEAKLLYADAIISDITGDTLEAAYHFEQLFESLEALKNMSYDDEFQYLEFNRLLAAAIQYYEDDAETIDGVETRLSVAVLRDKLNEYIYSQTLEDLEFVEETMEIIPGHVPITYNQRVASIIQFYQKKGRTSVQKWLTRMDRYKQIILPILEEEGVPPELFYLSMIESGLKPEAYSHKYASGLWQFVSATGKQYGLERSWWIDERNDFEKSTRAAARHLKDLYAEYNDWYLAFAAYNSGSGNVNRAIRYNDTRDYWHLSRLPRETRNYVPNIMAAIFIASDPAKYGFHYTSEPVLQWKIIEIDKPVKMDVISKCSGIDVATLKMYNPELRQNAIPPLEKDEVYRFRMPLTVSVDFDSLFSLVRIEKGDEIVLIDHKVRRGESLWLIAKKYNVIIQDIVALNKLQSARFIQPGQLLKIPTNGYQDAYTSTTVESQKFYYTVKRGDTLGEIAEKNRTSIRKLKKWNGLRGDFIREGQKLIIWKNA